MEGKGCAAVDVEGKGGDIVEGKCAVVEDRGGSPGGTEVKDIVDCVESFFYFSDEFTSSMTEWAKTNVLSLFMDAKTGSPEDGSGRPPDQYLAFQRYQAEFERLLEAHVQDKGFSVVDFVEALRSQDESLRGKRDNVSFARVAETYLSFEGFLEMMIEVRDTGEACFCPPLEPA